MINTCESIAVRTTKVVYRHERIAIVGVAAVIGEKTIAIKVEYHAIGVAIDFCLGAASGAKLPNPVVIGYFLKLITNAANGCVKCIVGAVIAKQGVGEGIKAWYQHRSKIAVLGLIAVAAGCVAIVGIVGIAAACGCTAGLTPKNGVGALLGLVVVNARLCAVLSTVRIACVASV